MKYEPTRNAFAQNAHDKAQDAIDHAREVREKKIADRGKSKIEPQLIADGNLQRCSGCGYPFQADEKPSVSVAFAEHLMKAHKPGQTSEDVNQAAARIASETTESS
jgi:predicted small metal-binding protein